MPQRETIVVPDLGDFEDVDVIDVLVEVGSTVAVEDSLITLETDKATMDVPASSGGVVVEVFVKVGDQVSKGAKVVAVEAEGAAQTEGAADAHAPAPEQPAPEPAPAPKTPPAPAPAAAGPAPKREPTRPVAPATPSEGPPSKRAHASPAVRKLARELGVDLGRVRGRGHRGRITKEDVRDHVKSVLAGGGSAQAALPQVPRVDFSKYGEVEVRPLSRIQRISGPRLHASWVNVPHVFQMDEADVTELESVRKEHKSEAAAEGIRLTALAFVLRACVLTLREFPQVNASLDPDGKGLVFKNYCNLGFAADTPNGLVVPVIHNADHKDVYELARDLGTLSARAREGKLAIDEMQGGTFTVSSLGGIGGTAFTPIINAPEVAILGVSRSKLQPVYRDGELVPRLMLPFTLSYDHRVIDGATAVRFTTHLAKTISDVHLLMEAVP